MQIILNITYNYVQPNDWDKINVFLKENNVKWYGHGVYRKSGIQDSSYIVGKEVDLNKIKSYPWPSEIMSVKILFT